MVSVWKSSLRFRRWLDTLSPQRQAGDSIKSIIPVGQRHERVIRQVPDVEELTVEAGYQREQPNR